MLAGIEPTTFRLLVRRATRRAFLFQLWFQVLEGFHRCNEHCEQACWTEVGRETWKSLAYCHSALVMWLLLHITDWWVVIVRSSSRVPCGPLLQSWSYRRTVSDLLVLPLLQPTSSPLKSCQVYRWHRVPAWLPFSCHRWTSFLADASDARCIGSQDVACLGYFVFCLSRHVSSLSTNCWQRYSWSVVV